MRTFFILLLLAVTISGVLAQQPAPRATPTPATKSHAGPSAVPDPPPSPDQVLKLLGLLRVRDELEITLDAMKQQLKDEATQSFSDKVPNPTPQQLNSVHVMVDDVFRDISLDDLIHDLMPVYQRHLTRSDVRALITFYSSVPGQKILREQPAMIKESMEVAGTSQQKRMEALLAKLEIRIQQLIAQEQGKAAPEKK
jgi:hypothetical protein